MRNNHRSPSHLLDLVYHRLFPGRASGRRDTRVSLPSESDISEHTDGFYLYSQSMIEQETERLAALKQQTTQSTEMSFSSARTEPYVEPSGPYSIGSTDWAFPSRSMVSSVDVDEVSENGRNSVLGVFTRVYSVAKVVMVVLLNYGVEPEDTCCSLALYIKRAEEVVTSRSIGVLIETAEKLFYVLQARLIMEMATVELCSSFTVSVHHLTIDDTFVLPHPRQMYKIMFAFKEMLDAPDVCSILDKEVLKQYEEEFIERAVLDVVANGPGVSDFLGFRSCIMGAIADPTSSFNRKWNTLTDVYKMPPADVLLTHSEKYMSILPKTDVQHDIATADLPFANTDGIRPDKKDRERVLAYRTATLAKLEGTTIGDIRRDNGRASLIQLVSEKKCICLYTCTCAKNCTNVVERNCPCSERLLRILLSQGLETPGRAPFGVRCGSLARVVFESLVAMKSENGDQELTAEVDWATRLFEHEVWVQRQFATKKT